MSTAALVDVPAGLEGEAAERWRILAPRLERRPTFDRELLATYCQVWARWRKTEAGLAKSSVLVKGPNGAGARPSPLLAISAQALSQVRILEQRLDLEGEDEPTTGADGRALLTRRELALAMDVHPQTVTKWERDGLPIAERGRKGKPSRYHEAACRAWRTAREDAARSSGLVDVAQERARKERAQAILAEQAYQARARELLPRHEVEKVWAAEVAAVRRKLLSWPMTLSDQLFRASALDGVAGLERVLTEAVHAVLLELSAAPVEEPAQPAPAPSRPSRTRPRRPARRRR